jgi:hypothetical protein
MAIRMRDCLGAAFAEVKNLGICEVAFDQRKKKLQPLTRRQASTGLSITLRGILIADIACRGLVNGSAGESQVESSRTVGRRCR